MNMNQKSWSLMCTMVNQKRGLAQNAEEIKAKAKQEVSAPKNYNKMLFQLKAFAALIKILFGDESITAHRLQAFVRQIETHNVFYKAYAALDNFFPSKVLWTVCTHFQLYLENCTRANDQEEVDCSLIDFSPDRQDIITSWFNVILTVSFKAVDSSSDGEHKERGGAGLGTKSKKRKQKEEKEKRSKRSSDNVVENKQQCTDFKLKEGKLWMQFTGMCLTERAKLNDTIMCTCWHIQAFCFNNCRNKASHVACLQILAEAKQAHLKWMQKVHSRSQ
jgi:hypothetical protein